MTDKVQEIMALPDWEHPLVQAAYKILCSDDKPPEGEHWEGFVARRFAAAAIESRLREVVAPPVPEPTTNAAGVPLRASLGHCRPEGLRFDMPPVVLSGYQLREALEFLAPDNIAEQLESEVCIALRDEGKDVDGEMRPRGMYCWLEEYPEEGSIILAGETPAEATHTQPASEPVARADALNTLCKMLHSGEEVEGDDGLAMLVPMDLWNEAQEAIELLVGEDDATPQPAAKQAEPVARDWVASLKIDMEASAWDGVIQLEDALKNIDDALAASPTQHTEAMSQIPGQGLIGAGAPIGSHAPKPDYMLVHKVTGAQKPLGLEWDVCPTQPRPQPLTEIEVAVGWKDSVTCTASLGSRAQAFEEGVRFAEKHFGITAQEPTE